MATTKLFAIKTTEVKALAYIANPEKTDGGRLIFTYGCSPNPAQASRDFEAVRAGGTGLNTVLSQHFIQSFKPGEITPERALEVGKELCEKFLKGEYQYFLAVHTDKAHTHLHVIFNNVSRENGRTFETNMNQGKVKERAWKKLIDLSDEVCKRHHLSVVEHPEMGKGKSHWDLSVGTHTLNCRIETADQKPVWKDSWFRRRCVIPASWYYEWGIPPSEVGYHNANEQRNIKKEKYAIQPEGAEITYLAGLYRFEEHRGVQVPMFAVITRESVEPVSSIHDRMPLILGKDSLREWVRPDGDPGRIAKRL